MPVKILGPISVFFNKRIDTGQFPYILKQALVFKNRFKGSKKNYRSVSILLVIFKIFEKLICQQITFIDKFLSINVASGRLM